MSVRTEVTAQQRREWIHDGRGAVVRVASVDGFIPDPDNPRHKTVVYVRGGALTFALSAERFQELFEEALGFRAAPVADGDEKEVRGGGDE